MIIKSCSTEIGFSNMLLPPIKNNKVTEAQTIDADSWAWNETLKAAHINNESSAIKPTVDVYCGFIKRGQIITIEAEFMNISGTKGKIAIDSFDNNLYNAGLQNQLVYSSIKSGEFEKIKISVVTKRDAYYKVIFGIFTADTGEYFIRNCKVSIGQVKLDAETNVIQSIKTGTVRTTSPGGFEKDTRFGDDGFSITTAANYIQVVFDKPFTYQITELRPVTSISGGAGSQEYEILCTDTQNASLTIQFFNRSTGGLVNISAIPTNVFFSFICIGSDVV